jgi:hypothetical protein
MNKRKWSDPGIPIEVLGLKLCEEAAEVGTEISDAALKVSKTVNVKKILDELDHVEFIAKQLRKRFAV